VPLGKGFLEFSFSSIEDMRKIWSLRLINLSPGLLRFFCWTKDFKPQNQVQTHEQIWIRLMHLPQEYWHKQTLFEIASGIGTPLSIDEATNKRLFGLYARVLVDVDLSSKLYNFVLVERDNHAFHVKVSYEKHLLFCNHCKIIGHSLQQCKKIANNVAADGAGHGNLKVIPKQKYKVNHQLVY